MCKILIIDDNYNTIAYYKEVIKKLHHCPDSAIHGKAALDLIDSTKKKYDMIIVDMEMPIMDGLSTIKQIRKKDKKIPIILVTAYSEPDKIKEALTTGANDVFLKPLTMNRLESMINHYTQSYAKAS